MILWLVLIAHLLGLASSLSVLMSGRTPQGTISWIGALILVPYLAVPLYWFFGTYRLPAYLTARHGEGFPVPRGAEDILAGRRERMSFASAVSPPSFSMLERLAGLPFVGGNEVEILVDGPATFESLFSGIDAARDYLLVEFYIVKDDATGRELRDRLARKAQEGVDVHFLYDEIGCYGLSDGFMRPLVEAGVHVQSFGAGRKIAKRLQLNFRNHRKIVVADGRRAWVGGLNVGDQYAGRMEGVPPSRDTHVRIDGPAVAHFQLAFIEDWYWMAKALPEREDGWEWAPPERGRVPVLGVPSGPADPVETASMMVQHLLHQARERVWIATPYFVPDDQVLSALKLTALRGIDVRVLIPERTDNTLIHLAEFAFLESLLRTGVRVFRYGPRFLHAKRLLVDRSLGLVGTVNLDNRSFRLNFEITVVAADREVAGRLEEIFEEDFREARMVTGSELAERPFALRAASRAANLLAPVL